MGLILPYKDIVKKFIPSRITNSKPLTIVTSQSHQNFSFILQYKDIVKKLVQTPESLSTLLLKTQDSIVYFEEGISIAGGSCGLRNTSFGYVQPVLKDHGGKQITSFDCRVRQGEQFSSHQKTSKTSYVDKQKGKYTRTTNKKVVSTGETFKERSTGRVGYKDEYKTTSTYRVGDKRGYTEHQLEEKIRRVDYSGSSGNKKGKKSAGSYKNDGAASISYCGPCKKYEESDEDEGGEDYENYEESDGDEGGEGYENYEESDGDEGGEESSYDYSYSDSD